MELIYLRKSQADNPNESVEEVLEKHEYQLQEYAMQELGYTIPEENIIVKSYPVKRSGIVSRSRKSYSLLNSKRSLQS